MGKSSWDVHPTFEQQKEFEYMTMVIKEALRLYPSVLLLPARITSEEVRFKDLVLPKGTQIDVAITAVHYSPKYWENPYEFNPERFSKENSDKIVPGSWIPFGGGTRTCKLWTFNTCKGSHT
jgi:cytochrome P450